MKVESNLTPQRWTRRGWLASVALLAGGLAAPKVMAATSSPGMPHAPAQAGQQGIPVAVLLGEGATLIDFAGPWEVLSSVVYAGCAGFDVYSVAATREPIICDDSRLAMGTNPRSGLRVIPDYTFEDAPPPRILMVGAQGGDDARKLEWIRRTASKAELTASVCTGAFLLGKAGLLDGKSATTNRIAYDAFEKKFPKVKLIRGVRLVEAGNIATATGLTAGIDLALHITDRFYGRDIAQKIAAYEEWPSQGWIVKA